MVIKELFATLGLDIDGEGFEKGEELIHSLHKGLLATGLAVVGVVAGLAELGRETAKAGEEASRAAQRLGITTDAYQELKFAAEESGVSTETLETALFRMSRAAYEAKHGSTEAAKAFHGLISLKQLKEDAPDELFKDMGEGLLKITDQGERANKIMTIFGRGGAPLINMLAKGREGLDEFAEEAHRLGVVLSEDTIKDSIEFNKAARETGAIFEGLKFKIGAFVLKGLLAVAHAFKSVTESIIKFKEAHADGIIQTLKLALIGLTAVTILYASVHAAAMATTISWYVALSIAAIRSALASAAAWVAAAWPILLVIAAIAGVLLVLEDLYQFLTGGESIIGDAVSIFTSQWEGLWNFLKDFFRWIVHVLFGDFILEKVDKVAAYVVEKLTAAFKKVKAFFGFGDTANGAVPAPAGFSAGAASPAASVANTVNTGSAGAPKIVAPNMGVHIEVKAAPGMDAKEVAGHVTNALDDWHNKKMREAAEGVE